MITCTNCGTQNADGKKFCDNCGTLLAQPIASVPPPTLVSVSNERGPLPVSLVATPIILSVKIADFNMPFLSLVGILVKIAVASIPATLILATIGAAIFLSCSIASAFLFAAGGRR